MPDQLRRQALSTFKQAWDERSTRILGLPVSCQLTLLSPSEGADFETVQASADGFSAGFIALVSGNLPGTWMCLLKRDDAFELDQIAGSPPDPQPMPGCRALIETVLESTASRLDPGGKVRFGDVKYVDLLAAPLETWVNGPVHHGKLTFTIENQLVADMLVLFIGQPIKSGASTWKQPASAPPFVSEPSLLPSPSPANWHRNIERLLNVEMDLVVRFGTTTLKLQEVVRLGNGAMIELNREASEPVEVLVNGRFLARGEVVVIDGYYGIRITEIASPQERPQLLG